MPTKAVHRTPTSQRNLGSSVVPPQAEMSHKQPAPTLRQPNPKQTLLTFLITLAIFSLVAYLTLAPPSLRRIRRTLPKPIFKVMGRISSPLKSLLAPLREGPDDLTVAVRSFSDYSFAQQRSVDAKWRAFERMRRKHRLWGDSLGWKTKLAEVEDRIEANAVITDELSAMGLEQAKKEGIPMGLRGKARGQDGRVVEVGTLSCLCWARD